MAVNKIPIDPIMLSSQCVSMFWQSIRLLKPLPYPTVSLNNLLFTE